MTRRGDVKIFDENRMEIEKNENLATDPHIRK
jgi:hypothetical protein